eukprot:CAMPEP_0170877866 /NCGR_PEP_ID=MMETSP0734-20130129/30595_1 /TAXON_ID=186038 /ORGANISM="Fragilariopsis kerguelensis, Strain L26-C5" /LENGTH=134 /DNA_ID=CAMNT_0011260281 /DNA_START=830 /DNA_END=1234 /DNA_ORIENTATION=-
MTVMMPSVNHERYHQDPEPNDDVYQQQQQQHSTMIIDQQEQQQQPHHQWTTEQCQKLEQVVTMNDVERRIVTTVPASTMTMATMGTSSLSSLASTTATTATASMCRRNKKNNTKKRSTHSIKIKMRRVGWNTRL